MKTRSEIEEAQTKTLAAYKALPNINFFGDSNIPGKRGAKQAFDFLCPEDKDPPDEIEIRGQYDEWWEEAEEENGYETQAGIAAQILEWALGKGNFCDDFLE